MKGMTLEEAVAYHYPLASVCAHLSTKEFLEQEAADDRYYDIVVKRCTNCYLALEVHYAEKEEVERLRNEIAQR